MRKLPHIYTFRLSDGDNRRYREILQRFKLDLRDENSKTFRLFLRKLHAQFMETDAEIFKETGIPVAHEEPHEVMREIEDPDEQLQSDILRVRGQIGTAIWGIAIQELRAAGHPFSPENIAIAQARVRKRWGVDRTHCPIEPPKRP